MFEIGKKKKVARFMTITSLHGLKDEDGGLLMTDQK